jgi:hypothetical protein
MHAISPRFRCLRAQAERDKPRSGINDPLGYVPSVTRDNPDWEGALGSGPDAALGKPRVTWPHDGLANRPCWTGNG